MAGEYARLYEAAVERMLPGYAAHPEYSTRDEALMSSLAHYLPFRTNPGLRIYAHSQLANLQRRIHAVRGISSPPINTRRRGRRVIEPVPGDLESQAARVEFMASRFESFGIPRSFPNGRRMESLQYRAYFSHTSRYLDEFWRAALQAIRDHIAPLQADRPVHITLGAGSLNANAGSRPITQWTSEHLSNAATKLVQSDSTIEPHDIIFTIVWFPRAPASRKRIHEDGDSPKRKRVHTWTDSLKRRRESTQTSPNKRIRGWGAFRPKELQNVRGLQDASPIGGLCGIKALVLGMDEWEKQQRDPPAHTRLVGSSNVLLRKARALARELGIPDDQRHSDLSHFQTFVEKYPEWRVGCFNIWRRKVGEGIWTGTDFQRDVNNPSDYGKSIFICYHEPSLHFARIPMYNFNLFGHKNHRKTGGGDVKTCGECLDRFEHRKFLKHKCLGQFGCKICGLWMKNSEEEEHTKSHEIKCVKCLVVAGSARCYLHHWRRCTQNRELHCHYCRHPFEPTELNELGYPNQEHKCKWFKCPNNACRKRMDPDDIARHRCYMAKCTPKKKKQSISLVDDEAVEGDEDEDEEDEEGINVNLNNHWAWDSEAYYEEEPSGRIDDDGRPIMNHVQIVDYIYALNLGNGTEKECDSIGEFVDWACNNDRDTSTGDKWVFWAHNAAKYDNRLVWDYAVNNLAPEDFKKNHVFVGNRLFELKLGNSTFRDSYLHIPQRLSLLPEMFGLRTNLKKGFFPYRFHTYNNRNYIGTLPKLRAFEPERRKTRDVYHPTDEDEQALIEWHKEKDEKVNADIAAGREGWNLRKENREYCRNDVVILMEALVKWRELNITPTNDSEPPNCDPLASLTLPSHAHKSFRTFHLEPGVIPILKCFINSDLPDDPANNEDKLCRRAYRGGNTNVRCLLKELTVEQMLAGHRLAMFDVVSMYPNVMVRKEYPGGNLEHIPFVPWGRQPTTEEIMATNGVICCEIEFDASKPPLFHPILCRMQNGKLTFDLSACDVTLAEIMHWEDDACGNCATCRKMTGRERPVYILAEVHKALQHGYKILYTYWIHKAPKMYKDIFKSYIGSNYKLKARSGKPPSSLDFNNPEVCERYIREHEEIGADIQADLNREELTLKEWFNPNTGLKTCSKLRLNSLYGKFGENSFHKTTKVVTSQEEEEDLFAADGYDLRITSREFHDNAAVITYEEPTPGRTIGTTNVMVAGHITAYARLDLWEIMNRYGTDVLYHDTDSVIIHLRPPSDPEYKKPPETGPYLGDLEEEVGNAQGFVSIGPKSYCLKSWIDAHPDHYKDLGHSQIELARMNRVERDILISQHGQGILRWSPTASKMEFAYVKQRNKGIVLNADTERFVNYDSMRMMVQAMVGAEGYSPEEARVTVNEKRFEWDREACIVFITEGVKTVEANRAALKGKLGADLYTLYPFGAERFPQWHLLET